MTSYLPNLQRFEEVVVTQTREAWSGELDAIRSGLDEILRGMDELASLKPSPEDELELARRSLALRKFNSMWAALGLLERGCYQQSLALVRMAMEDRLVAIDVEKHPRTLEAYLHDPDEKWKGKLSFKSMASRCSPKEMELWDHDYGIASALASHPRAGSFRTLADNGPGQRPTLHVGNRYNGPLVRVILGYLLIELLYLLAQMEILTYSVGGNWAMDAEVFAAKALSAWRRIQ